ncbi:MAG: hypothetical protein HFJ58_04325 [Clostridia bacterium]|nr:hypothetical protein [Clostridia bacterium]
MRKNNRKRNKKNTYLNPKKIILPILIIFALLIFSSIFALTNALGETIISRVKINNIDVSNLTINEAYQKLKEQFDEQVSKNIKVKQGEYETTISLEQIEVKYDIIEAINEAYKIGRNKNIIISNYSILKTKLFSTKIEKAINMNEEELNKVIDDISAKIPGVVTQSSYYIEGDNLIISNGKAGIEVNKEEFKKRIIDAIKKQIKGKEIDTIEIPIEQKEPEKLDIEKIREEIYKEPQDAYYEENPVVLHKEVNGIDLKISIEEAKTILEEQKDEYVIPLTITKPEITVKDLKNQNFFPEQISKYVTRYDESNINRSTNIKLASEKIDGTILMPGETFSYNKIVGERTIKAGYKEASVYMGGKVVDGIGGGICQVSSTLYNAVLEANLEVTSRRNHYFITGYVSASRDATVSYGTIDFKFKNTRTYPIKIECLSQNGICQIEIKGIKEDIEYEVVIEDKITEVIPYTTKYIKTNKLEKGVENEIQKGVNGYKSEAYRILRLNGKVISKTLLSKDSYNPLQRIVEQGTK